MRANALPVYYGWFVLAASAVSELLVQGATLYSAGLFVLPLQAEFHISRAAANSSILVLFLGVVFMAPVVGKQLDRWPIRKVMVLGAIILAFSLSAITAVHSLWIMSAILLLPLAAVFMGLGQLNTTTLASRWFYKRRGLALGIAAVATSGGGLVAPLLSAAIQNYGWREALFWEGLMMAALIIVLTLLFIRDRPADLGLADHPENKGRPSRGAAGDGASLAWKEFLFSRGFWIPGLTVATISAACQALVITVVPYGVQIGIAPTAAALAVSLFAIAAAITKICAGLLADRIDQRYLLSAAALSMTLSWLVLSLFASQPALLSGACLGGIALGCALPTAAGLIAGIFGSAHFAQVFGWCFTLTALLAIAAVRFVGFMYDKFGGYHAAFECFAALLAVLLAMTVLFKPQRLAA
jgi:MFS family permease